MRTLNLETRSAQHTASGFFAFAAMAEACILPYTTLYMKHLGLSATHVGLLKSIQSFLTILTLIFWVHFATRFNAHRLVIVSSVLVSIIGFLCVTLLPPLDTSVYLISCPYNPVTGLNRFENVTSVADLLKTENKNREDELTDKGMEELIKDLKTEMPGLEKDGDELENDVNPVDERRKVYRNVGKEYFENNARIDEEPDYDFEIKRPNFDEIRRENLDVGKNWDGDTETDSQSDYRNGNAYYDDEGSFPFKRSMTVGRERKFDKRSILSSIWDKIYPYKETTTTTSTTSITTTTVHPDVLTSPTTLVTMSIVTDIYADLDYASTNPDPPPVIENNLNPNRLTYLLLFITFMLGWIFGSPAVTVADQAWYGFLDDMDLTEKYGKHYGYCLFLAGLASLASSLSVAMTNCRLWFNVDHFNIHIYSYAFLMLFALLFAFCFPVVSSKFSLALPQTTKMSEYRLLFCDLGLSLVTITAILAGVFNCIVQDFLLWIVEDMGGNEFHFGTIVSLSFLVEIFAINTSRYFFRKLKLYPLLIFSLTVFSLRLLFFSFMWNPWSAVAGQFIHLFSAILMPAVASAYLSRTSDHSSYRAIRTVVAPCLELFGRTIGSFVFGIGYDAIGAIIMFQIAAAVGFVWSFVLLIAYKVKLSNSKRYVKLIHVQQIEGMMGDSETDDDWLDDAVNKPDISPTSA